MDLEKIVSDKRHKELLSKLSKISEGILSAPNSGEEIVNAIYKQCELLSDLVGMMKTMQQGEKKEEKEPEQLTKIQSLLSELLAQFRAEEKDEKPTYKHTITKRDFDGRVSEIISTPIKQ